MIKNSLLLNYQNSIVKYINIPRILNKRMKLKKHDFIEVDYTGKLEDGTIFDTTDEKVAEEAGLQRENAKFEAAVICLGENHVLKGIEDAIIGKEPGSFEVNLTPETAFGKKNPKLLKLLPMKVFRKEKIQPFPGLEVNVDNQYGIVRTVSGGRIIVDFNHPLSGHNLVYSVKVNKIIKDNLEKAKSIFKNELNITDTKLELKDNKLIIDENIPKDVLDGIKKRVLELVPEIKGVSLKKEEKVTTSSSKKKK